MSIRNLTRLIAVLIALAVISVPALPVAAAPAAAVDGPATLWDALHDAWNGLLSIVGASTSDEDGSIAPDATTGTPAGDLDNGAQTYGPETGGGNGNGGEAGGIMDPNG